MEEYDILANIKFLSAENGGRQSLPPIKDSEYTYRPVFRLKNTKIGYCCGVVIGNYLQNYAFEIELLNVKIIFLDFQKIMTELQVGNKFELLEGNKIVAVGEVIRHASQ